MMTFTTPNLVLVFIFLLVSILLIVSFVYCCVCDSTIGTLRRRYVHWQMTRVRDEESPIISAQSQAILSIHQQIREDIRHKYQLK